jgi:hypothetical protein
MQELTGVGYFTSDQHKEATRARKERDRKDTLAILEYLCDRNPFTPLLNACTLLGDRVQV